MFSCSTCCCWITFTYELTVSENNCCSVANNRARCANTRLSACRVPAWVAPPRYSGCVATACPVKMSRLLRTFGPNPLRYDPSPYPAVPDSTTVGRQPASACGTVSSVARSCARAACSVGLLE